MYRKPSGEDSNEAEVSEDETEFTRQSEELRTVQLQNRSEGSSYGRLFSWGIDGVSYLGSQVRSKVDRTLSWWSTSGMG